LIKSTQQAQEPLLLASIPVIPFENNYCTLMIIVMIKFTFKQKDAAYAENGLRKDVLIIIW
jgi:hypothetical protein